MGKYTVRNDRLIDRAFSRLPVVKDRVVEDGMCRLLKDAMEYAISNHDHNHFGHRIHDNSYGWALLHDHSVVRLQVNGGRHGHGDAEDQLMIAARSVTKGGWVGILLASMVLQFGRKKPVYFEIDYEHGILEFTKDDIQSHFKEYFKPLSA